MRKTRMTLMIMAVAALTASSVGIAAAQDAETTTSPSLKTKTMEPGVERILADDAGHDLTRKYPKHRRDMDAIAVAPDGTVWIASTAHGDDNSRLDGFQVWALGMPGIYGKKDGVPNHLNQLMFDADGRVVAFGSGLSTFDGESWTNSDLSRYATTPDGRIWYMNPQGDGLESWDGSEHTVQLRGTYVQGFTDLENGSPIAIGHNGRATYEDGEWTLGVRPSPRRIGLPDGSLWMIGQRGGGIERISGDTTRHYLKGTNINQLALAPDGMVWAVGSIGKKEGGVYRIDPSAPAAVE